MDGEIQKCKNRLDNAIVIIYNMGTLLSFVVT